MTAHPPTVSVVLGTYNRLPFLKATLASVRRDLADVRSEIIVVDGGSTDGTTRWLARQKDVIMILQHNRGTWQGRPIHRRSWGYFMNLGFKCAQADYIMMLSDDCLLVPGATRNGLAAIDRAIKENPRVAAAAFYWRDYPRERAYKVGRTFGNLLFVNHGLYVRSALQQVGWIDEDRYMFYHADGDLCLKLWDAGYSVIAVSDAFVEHFAHARPDVRASNKAASQKDWQAYLDRWNGRFYDGTSATEGGWEYQDFTDVHATVRGFPRQWRTRLPSKRRRSSLLNRARRAIYAAIGLPT